LNVRRHLFSAVIAALALAFLWVPLLMTVINAVNKDDTLTGWGGATLHWFGEAAGNTDARSGLRSTLLIAIATSVLSVAIAVTGALWWRRAGASARRAFDLLVYLRIVLPEVVFAASLFLFMSRVDFPLGTTAVVIGHTVWASAYATLILQAGVIGLDPALEDAAADLGATAVRTFRRVILPSLLPAILAAALLTFTFSFDDVVTSFYLAGSKVAPLPVVLLSMIRFRIGPEINAIGLLVMAITIATMAITLLLSSRMARRSRAPLPIPGTVQRDEPVEEVDG
jgi:ABC-type spermidine/putrescine transport system permease subunit II